MRLKQAFQLRVMRLAHAGDDVFATNEAEVMRERTAFLEKVPFK